MKKVEFIQQLGKYPLFTINEYIKLTKETPEYARTSLHRLSKEKLVFQVERGKYTVHDDPLLFASHIQIPSYISFWTAIRFHNLTEQLPLDIMIASPKPKPMIQFGDTKIRFFKIKHFWGYGKQRYGDFNIFMADKEKCIVDSLLIKNMPFDEIAKAVSYKELDIEKLIKYMILTGNISLIKRLGYVMEQFGLRADELIKHLDNNYILLDWNMRKHGKKDMRWKVIVNWWPDDIN